MCFNVLLMTTSFVLPPMGVIDNSVLLGVGELTVMGLFGMIPYYLETGKHIKVSKGDTEIEVNGSDRVGVPHRSIRDDYDDFNDKVNKED